MVDMVKLSPNNSGARTHKIDRISPHCIVGQLDAATIGDCFTSKDSKASCNYGIGIDLKVVECVPECNRSWCTSSNSNDQRAVTIECASDKTSPYKFKQEVYEKLVQLCADICTRNGIDTVIWFGEKKASLEYEPKEGECVLTVHRWFANKECPGDWLYERMGKLANDINAVIQTKKLYRVQVGAFTIRANAEKLKQDLRSKGYDCFIQEVDLNGLE